MFLEEGVGTPLRRPGSLPPCSIRYYSGDFPTPTPPGRYARPFTGWAAQDARVAWVGIDRNEGRGRGREMKMLVTFSSLLR